MNASMKKISYSKFVDHSGFTLVELMVTIVVLGIIASIAAPNISNQLANQRVRSATVTLMSVLKEARAESNINKMPLTVSYSNGNQSDNFINVEAPYSGPLVSAYSTVNFDWTNIFFKSALALGPPPKDTGGSSSGGSSSGGSSSGGSSSGGDSSGGGSSGGDSSGGGSSGGGSSGGDSSGGDSSGGGSSGGDSSGGGSSGGDSSGGDSSGGDSSGGDSSGGDSSDDGTTGDTKPNLVIIATHHYDKRVIIKSSPEKITFKPNRTVDNSMTYTICHSNKSVSPQQVNVSKNGLISSNIGGSCQ